MTLKTTIEEALYHQFINDNNMLSFVNNDIERISLLKSDLIPSIVFFRDNARTNFSSLDNNFYIYDIRFVIYTTDLTNTIGIIDYIQQEYNDKRIEFNITNKEEIRFIIEVDVAYNDYLKDYLTRSKAYQIEFYLLCKEY